MFTNAGGDCKAADVIGEPAVARGDEVGERGICASFTADKLLAQSMQNREALDATFIGENRDVVALKFRPQANHSRRPKPIFGDDIVEHRERVAIKRTAPQSLTKSVVVENGGKFPLEIPSGKER